MTEDFVPDSSQTSDPGTPFPAIPPSDPHRDPLKILIISSPKGVTSTIHALYRLGYAQVSEWSKPQPTQTPGEVMSILRRRIPVD